MKLRNYRVSITLDSHDNTTTLRSVVLHVKATSATHAPLVAEDALCGILNTHVAIVSAYVSETN